MALTNGQYDSIMREYDKRRIKNQQEYDKKLNEIYTKDSRFQKIDEEIANLSLKQARLLLKGDKNAISTLRNELDFYNKKRREILSDLGLAPDYLDESFTCNDCKDTGYIGNKKCHCFRKTATDILYSQSNLKNILLTENFETFSYDYYSDSDIDSATGYSSLDLIRVAVTECKNFVKNFDTEYRNILLYGDTGVGKTFLSNCIAKELLDSSHSVIYYTAFEIFDILASGTFNKEKSTDEIYDYLFNCDLLIIDDLGTELTNSFILSQLFLIVNERILRRKSTIISTNLSLDKLSENYSERTFSRIMSNFTLLKVIGHDIRILKKIKK